MLQYEMLVVYLFNEIAIWKFLGNFVDFFLHYLFWLGLRPIMIFLLESSFHFQIFLLLTCQGEELIPFGLVNWLIKANVKDSSDFTVKLKISNSILIELHVDIIHWKLAQQTENFILLSLLRLCWDAVITEIIFTI